MEHQRSKCYKFLFDNGLIITVSIGVALGFAFGLGLRHLTPSNDAITWIGKGFLSVLCSIDDNQIHKHTVRVDMLARI